jgi:ubiquinone/menaquinone biosynthesis C-methylase UbiE
VSQSSQDFASTQYGPRAADYVSSSVHSNGADLDQIEALVSGHPNAIALDLGCGGGHVSYRAAPHVARVVACDVTPAMLEVVQKTAAERGLSNISVKQTSAETLPFDAGTFDFVLCRFTTHHWQNMEAGLREARRVLKPGGTAIFVDTVAPAIRVLDTHLQAIELLRDISHIRNYSVAEWISALSRSGFSLQSATIRKLHLEFGTWIARTRTSPDNADSILRLQRNAPDIVREHFAVAADGSFDIECASFVVREAAAF